MTTSTYEESPARRPGTSDVQTTLEDDSAAPPDVLTQPAAGPYNMLGILDIALARVSPVAVISVANSGTSYTVESVACCNSTLTTSDFTPTRNGAGDVTVAWTGADLPARNNRHTAHPAGATPLIIACETLTNSARVRMVNHANTATDGSFVLVIY